MKKAHKNFVPRITWECEALLNRGYWIVNAYAAIPGAPDLEVSTEYHVPFIYAERNGGILPCMAVTFVNMETSISYKYNMLVRKHAHKNKHAQAALAVINDWQDKRDAK